MHSQKHHTLKNTTDGCFVEEIQTGLVTGASWRREQTGLRPIYLSSSSSLLYSNSSFAINHTHTLYTQSFLSPLAIFLFFLMLYRWYTIGERLSIFEIQRSCDHSNHWDSVLRLSTCLLWRIVGWWTFERTRLHFEYTHYRVLLNILKRTAGFEHCFRLFQTTGSF